MHIMSPQSIVIEPKLIPRHNIIKITEMVFLTYTPAPLNISHNPPSPPPPSLAAAATRPPSQTAVFSILSQKIEFEFGLLLVWTLSSLVGMSKSHNNQSLVTFIFKSEYKTIFTTCLCGELKKTWVSLFGHGSGYWTREGFEFDPIGSRFGFGFVYLWYAYFSCYYYWWDLYWVAVQDKKTTRECVCVGLGSTPT